MKKIILLFSLMVLFSCKSYYSMSDFYSAHKHDQNVTAIEVPRFMFGLLKGLSPEMNATLQNVSALRYLQLTPENTSARAKIQQEINLLTNERFTDIYRRNIGVDNTLISVREQQSSIREIIVHLSNQQKHTILYLRGRFDPRQIRDFAEQGNFDNLLQSITQQNSWNTTPPISY